MRLAAAASAHQAGQKFPWVSSTRLMLVEPGRGPGGREEGRPHKETVRETEGTPPTASAVLWWYRSARRVGEGPLPHAVGRDRGGRNERRSRGEEKEEKEKHIHTHTNQNHVVSGRNLKLHT